MTLTGRQVLAGIVSFVVLAAIVTGVVMLGGRLKNELGGSTGASWKNSAGSRWQSTLYYSKNGVLPASLDELWKGVGLQVSSDAIRDPVPANAYRYRVLGAENFELCGTFERASEPQTRGGVDVWQHPAGAHCFTLKVEKRSTQ